jgi:hypothetical protein
MIHVKHVEQEFLSADVFDFSRLRGSPDAKSQENRALFAFSGHAHRKRSLVN